MDHSSFGKLPTELRLEIFEYVLFSANETGVFEWDEKGLILPSWMTTDNRQALTMVCSQFRAETFPRFYRCEKILFRPMVLDKFQPGFFLAQDETQLQMMWNYLGPPRRWQCRLASLLDHLGPEIRRNVKNIDIDIGTWESAWKPFDNPLIVWLSDALAATARLFEASGIQVNLCFPLLVRHWTGTRNLGQLFLPISNIAIAHEILRGFIQAHKSKCIYKAYPRLSRAWQMSLERNAEILHAYLGHLDTKIKGLSSYEGSLRCPDASPDSWI